MYQNNNVLCFAIDFILLPSVQQRRTFGDLLLNFFFFYKMMILSFKGTLTYCRDFFRTFQLTVECFEGLPTRIQSNRSHLKFHKSAILGCVALASHYLKTNKDIKIKIFGKFFQVLRKKLWRSLQQRNVLFPKSFVFIYPACC